MIRPKLRAKPPLVARCSRPGAVIPSVRGMAAETAFAGRTLDGADCMRGGSLLATFLDQQRFTDQFGGNPTVKRPTRRTEGQDRPKENGRPAAVLAIPVGSFVIFVIFVIIVFLPLRPSAGDHERAA